MACREGQSDIFSFLLSLDCVQRNLRPNEVEALKDKLKSPRKQFPPPEAVLCTEDNYALERAKASPYITSDVSNYAYAT